MNRHLASTSFKINSRAKSMLKIEQSRDMKHSNVTSDLKTHKINGKIKLLFPSVNMSTETKSNIETTIASVAPNVVQNDFQTLDQMKKNSKIRLKKRLQQQVMAK